MARRSAQRVAFYHRHAANDPEPASIADQEAALRSYLAAHPESEIIPVFDSDQPQPFDRPDGTGQPLSTSPTDAAHTTSRSGRTHRRRRT